MTLRFLRRCASGAAACLGLAAVLAALPAWADEPSDRDAAVAAAREEAAHWLEALDAGRHEESWNDVASVMKEARNQEEWVRDVAAPRGLLGKSVMRELERSQFSTVVRGAPSGKYVTLRYLTQFANAPPFYETILMTLEDEHWRIAGYSIERAPEPAAPAPAEAAPAPRSVPEQEK
jgi:uncharacterized protein DUF4019